MSVDCVPGGCIQVWFVVDLGCLVCRLVDPHVLGVVLRRGEKESCPPCMVCVY